MAFKVYRLELINRFCVVTAEKRAHVGDLTKTIKTMLELGITIGEIEAGLLSLVSNDHAVADYGVNGTFIFSKSA